MIKKLAGCVREYWLVSLLAPITVVGEVILEVIIPKLMADLIDFGINKGDMSYIWLTGAKLVTACLISLLCGALAGMFAPPCWGFCWSTMGLAATLMGPVGEEAVP